MVNPAINHNKCNSLMNTTYRYGPLSRLYHKVLSEIDTIYCNKKTPMSNFAFL